MKNAIIALSLLFAVGASAQTKTNKATTAVAPTETIDPRTTVETAAQKDFNALIAYTPVDSKIHNALMDLFTTKHNLLKEVAGLSAERQSVVTETVEYRLSLLLEPVAFAKLKSNKDLYSSLIN